MIKNPSAETEPRNDDPELRAWDAYWQDGRLASCGGAGGAAYQAAITEGWWAFFAGLPAGSRILDACTGNGAVARVAEEVALAGGGKLSIDAFDAALIAGGAGTEGQSLINFRSRVMAEALPYADDCFDAVVSQYGIEYSDMERSVAELARVSAPGCRVRLMVHAAEGVVVESAGRQLADARQLLGSGVFEAARTLAEGQRDGLEEQALHGLIDRYAAVLRQLEQAAAASVEPEIYANTCSVLTHALAAQGQVGAGPVLGKIDEAVENVRAHEARLGAMQQAALDEAAAGTLAERIGELWGQQAAVEPGRRADGAQLGWIITSGA